MVGTAPLVSPCSKCPWVSNDPRDVEAIERLNMKAAALAGRFICCHTKMGSCAGAARFVAEQEAKKPGN